MYTFNPAHELSRIEQTYGRADQMLRLPSSLIFSRLNEFSRWSVAEHLVHLARTNLLILDSIDNLIEGRGKDEQGVPTRLGSLLLLVGRIPRRRAQAQKSIHPPPSLTRAEALEVWNESRNRLQNLRRSCRQVSGAQQRHKHQIFGALSASEWTRFASIHTDHHVNMPEDIIHLASGAHG